MIPFGNYYVSQCFKVTINRKAKIFFKPNEKTQHKKLFHKDFVNGLQKTGFNFSEATIDSKNFTYCCLFEKLEKNIVLANVEIPQIIWISNIYKFK